MATTKPATVADLAAMPEDEYRYDLIRGVLKQMTPTGFRHLFVTGRFIWFLNDHVIPRELGVVGGEGGFILEIDPDTLLAPDVAFVRMERVPPEDEWDRFVRLAPDLVVEVLSPSDADAEMEKKVRAYLEAGVRLVWVADPSDRTVRVRKPDGTDIVLAEADILDGDEVLPEFRVPVAQLFAWKPIAG